MKMLRKCVAVALVAIGGATLPLFAHAAFTTYSGLDLSSLTAPGGAPLQQRGSFIDALETGKSQSNGLTGVSVSTLPDPNDPTKTLLGFELANVGATVYSRSTDSKTRITNEGCDGLNCNGRFNTTGDTDGPWWETKDNFSIKFANALSAFGFYATDVGDFGARVTLELLGTDGKVLEIVDFSKLKTATTKSGVQQLNDDEATPNGSLLFFGFTDTERQIGSINFLIGQVTGGTNDYIGFDDFITGPLKSTTEPPGIPEPATLALVAASLAALAATRRRRPS
jgi:hypothetical protein